MKNDTIEKQILLRGSGELTAGAAEQLDAMMANDPALLAYAKDAGALQSVAKEALSVDGPDASVTQRILARAEALDADPKPQPFARRVMQVMAYAAALVLAFGLWQFNRDVQRSDRISEVGAMLTFAEDESDAASAAGVEDLESLAELLLEMQGFTQDEDGVLDEEWFMPPVEHPPTAIQGNSSPASPERKYG